MTREPSRCLVLGAAIATGLLCSLTALEAQPPDPVLRGAVSEAGLLPIFAVDLGLDSVWIVQTAGSGGSSSLRPEAEQAIRLLQGSGISTFRIDLDLRDPTRAASQLANLCDWANQNGLSLVPVLRGAPQGTPLGSDFARNVAAFTTEFHQRLTARASTAFPSCILAFQIERQLNRPGAHGALTADQVQQRVLEAASALRQAEQQALKGGQTEATPIIVSVSFDVVLLTLQQMAGTPIQESAYQQARDSLAQFLSGLAHHPQVDVFDVEWLPGSLGAGGADLLSKLFEYLEYTFRGARKQFTFSTGLSTALRTGEAQGQFIAAAFANLADHRVQSGGLSSPFLGVFFREGLDRVAAPDSTMLSRTASWDWAAQALALATAWRSGAEVPPDLRWWLEAVEGRLGVLSRRPTPTGGVEVFGGPGQAALAAIASVVQEANTAGLDSGVVSPTPALADSNAAGFGSRVKGRVESAMLGLLDRVVDRLGTRIGGGAGGGGVGGNQPPPGGPDAPPGGGASVVLLSNADVHLTPAGPTAGMPARVRVTLRNQSATVDATGLVVALVEPATYTLLGDETQASGIDLGRGGVRTVDVPWTPAQSGPIEVVVVVADAAFYELARASLGTVTVASSPGGGTPPPSGPEVVVIQDPVRGLTGGRGRSQTRLGLPQLSGLRVGPGPDRQTEVSLQVVNPYSAPLPDLVVTLELDGTRREALRLGTLLPGQRRSVTLRTGAAPAAGIHRITVGAARAGAVAGRGASLTTDIGFDEGLGPRARRDERVVPARDASVVAVPGTGAHVRPIGPDRIRVGQTVVATGPLRVQAEPAANRGVRVLGPRRGLRQLPAATPVLVAQPSLTRPDLRVTARTMRVQHDGGRFKIDVEVQNVGSGVATGARLLLQLAGSGRPANQSFSLTLGPGENRTISWTQIVNAAPEYQITVQVSEPGDLNLDDNAVRLTVPGSPFVKPTQPRQLVPPSPVVKKPPVVRSSPPPSGGRPVRPSPPSARTP